MLDPIFDKSNWAPVPPGFWALVFFVLGSMVGSFLNVVIYRLPLGLSVVHPPSHCPHCKYSIPWFLNVPLLTWLMLQGRCRNCRAPISPRYFLVELLTAVAFLAAWLTFGRVSAWIALVICVLLAGLIAATFIDFDHFIIPDEITIGGAAAGFLFSFLLPGLHGRDSLTGGMKESFLGMLVGGGVVYAIVRLGKWLFGRQKVTLPTSARIVFTESALHLPDRQVPYEELFYRQSDAIVFHARTVELIDRGYQNVRVKVALLDRKLVIGEDQFDPETVPHLEAVAEEIVLPREAMGLGDVKFMAAIGAFLGWQATLFSLMISSMIGAAVGLSLIAIGKRQWSTKLPYGPYIAVAAVIWIFWGPAILDHMFPPTTGLVLPIE